ncbi:helix-turn-helix domain-containing protein [Faecalibacter macacae]|uniref:DNA-binding protein n=1 Tax=Faecalibacter macacae TaxID=1859289 RepID=A0A3L9M539_9FLAO|nr:helix-turn-helix domain-containing protein [Faecalibacter macacae]RLZ08048.1 DNA-binding protein [Faecalibacter macacae]
MSKRFVDRGVENYITRKVVRDSDKVIEKMNYPIKEDRLKQKEVAEMFDTTVQTIINWRKAGKIPFYKIGRNIIYSRSQLIQIASKNQELVKA